MNKFSICNLYKQIYIKLELNLNFFLNKILNTLYIFPHISQAIFPSSTYHLLLHLH
jgi:hypothetical protein